MSPTNIAPKLPQTRACVLEACAREVEHLAEACEKIEDALGKALLGKAPASAALVVELQDLDRVRQTLTELGPLLLHLANTDRNIDIKRLVENLSLRDLRQRIGRSLKQSLDATPAGPMPPNQHGNVDWF